MTPDTPGPADPDGPAPVQQAGFALPGYYRYDRETVRDRLFADSRTLEVKLRTHETFRTNPRTVVDHVVDCLDVAPGADLLDLGCGNGVLALRLADAVGAASMTGLDLAPGVLADAVREARSHDADSRWVEGSANDLGMFAEASFDRVTACYMLHYVPDLAATVVGIRRVLRPGGRMVLTTDSAQTMPEMYGVHFRALEALGAPDEVRMASPKHHFSLENGAERLAPHVRTCTRRDYADVLRFPEAEPFVEFYAQGYRFCSAASLPRMPEEFYRDLLEHVRGQVDEIISRRGAFDVTKRTGSFVCD